MSDIANRISAAATHFEVVGYQGRPTKLLLGRREMEEFEEQVVKQLHTVLSTGASTRRATYMGMDIYPVDDAEFLGVA